MLRPKKKLTRKEIKQDKLVTYYFKFNQLVQNNFKFVLGGLAAIVLIALVTMMVMNSKRNAEKSASREFLLAMAEYQRGNYTDAAEMFQTMINAYGGTKSAAAGTYYLANAYYQTGKFDQALEFYKKFARKHAGDQLLGRPALIGVANCLVQKQQFKEAAEQFMQVVKKYPKSIEAPESLLNAGLAYFQAQEIKKAETAFEQLVKDYPESSFKTDAETKLAKLRSTVS